MANTYSNAVVEDLVWSEIEHSQNAHDFLTFLEQFPAATSSHWWAALDKAVSLFCPPGIGGAKSQKAESRYGRAFERLQVLAGEATDLTEKGIVLFNLGKMTAAGYGTEANRDLSINFYKRAIGLGELRALINCGGHYDGPKATAEDLAFADQLFAQALAQGEPMGLIRQADRIDDNDDPRKYELCLQAADHGSAYGLHRVGSAHYFGSAGQREDEALGVSWLQRAARAGSPEACRLLGWHFDRDDKGHTPDGPLSLEWQSMGAKLGDVPCMRSIGFKHLLGIDCEIDIDQGNYWLHRAAVLGDHKAQYHMGHYWLRSEDANKHPLGFAWLKLSADNGNDFAAWRTSIAYRDGLGCRKNKAQSISYCIKAAKAGYPDAQGQLGLHYWHGNGVEKNFEEAYKWINLCALQGQGLGLYLLGVLTLRGLGCTQDEKEGIRLLRAAADKGEIEAIHEIGDCYYFGYGVEKDVATAAVWYRRGAQQGHGPSMTDLGYLLKEGEGVLCNPVEAFDWFTKAIELGDARAMYMMALLYAYGDGVERSPELCRRWMGRAAMLNHTLAKQWIERNLPKAPQWLEQIASAPNATSNPDTTEQPND